MRGSVIDPVAGTVILVVVLGIAALAAVLWPNVTVVRGTIGAGVVLIGWGQIFLAFGFIAGWRLLFAPTSHFPPTAVGGSPIADFAAFEERSDGPDFDRLILDANVDRRQRRQCLAVLVGSIPEITVQIELRSVARTDEGRLIRREV